MWHPSVRNVAAALTLTLLPACSPREDPPGESDLPQEREASATAPAGFVNRVWVVAESEQVPPGDLRVFLQDGTLVMSSPHSTPAFGTWAFENGHLTVTEEGLTYGVDILELTPDTFAVRINSPGEPVTIRFVPAALPPWPGQSP